ncbi:hypothetical protein [Ruegeria sp. HKCCA5763]|uniref:hypothetical protein n=1 Tax=Ruegeria sp. HKCCA5763 TaxID=2682987 RepID=UPI001488DC2C|nr:hypothetical protein [Ruegeria sp. HKCCA5763]
MANDMTTTELPLPEDVGKLESVAGPDPEMITFAREAVRLRKLRYWRLGYKTKLISKREWYEYLAATEVPAKAS